MSNFGKGAGRNGGPPTRPTLTRAPEFIRWERREMEALNALAFPLAGWVYFVLMQHSDFETGEFLGGYPRLMELSTEPRPQQGPRVKGPTYDQMRRAVRALVDTGLVRRGDNNSRQGQLRLYLIPRRRSRA